MRKTVTYCIVLGLVFVALQTANAQSDNDKSKGDEQNDNIGERIGKSVERLVSRLTGERWEDEE
ncbi:MAG TPA: hypothetical protein VFO86_09415, partial [Terriglobia bacterium]|nr:hypothetical protein [Terriglobia bacterium]